MLSFLEGSGWESGFPLRRELAFLTEQETLSGSGSAGPAGPGLRAEPWDAGGQSGCWGQVFCWGVALAGVPSASLPGGRPDARQSNELPGVWKRLEPGSVPTSGPLPFPATLSGATGYEGLPVGREKSPSPHP